MAGIGRPTKQDLVLLDSGIAQNLKNSGEHARLWAIAAESLIEKGELFWGHCRRAAPIRPGSLALFVIVCWHEVNHGMDETQDKAFGSPADDDVDCHVVAV